MPSSAYLLLYCLAVIAVSLVGGWVPIYVRLTHRRMQLANSLVAGFMLGIALLLLLPHALMAIDVGAAMGWLIAGLLVMFFLERFFCYHHHDVPQGAAFEADDHHHVHQVADEDDAAAGADQPARVEEHAGHSCGLAPQSSHRLSWTGAAVGLVLHSLIDGVALSAAVFAEPALEHGSFWPGLAVFLVVALHRPLDAMTLLTLTQGGRWTTGRRHVLNGLFALAVPAGAGMFLVGVQMAEVEHSASIGAALAFAAGVFLCVSLSDLLPELQFHHHDRVKLSLTLLAGLGLAAAVYLVESTAHDHGHGEAGGAGTGEVEDRGREHDHDHESDHEHAH